MPNGVLEFHNFVILMCISKNERLLMCAFPARKNQEITYDLRLKVKRRPYYWAQEALCETWALAAQLFEPNSSPQI
jgi:hypothetical protein